MVLDGLSNTGYFLNLIGKVIHRAENVGDRGLKKTFLRRIPGYIGVKTYDGIKGIELVAEIIDGCGDGCGFRHDRLLVQIFKSAIPLSNG